MKAPEYLSERNKTMIGLAALGLIAMILSTFFLLLLAALLGALSLVVSALTSLL